MSKFDGRFLKLHLYSTLFDFPIWIVFLNFWIFFIVKTLKVIWLYDVRMCKGSPSNTFFWTKRKIVLLDKKRAKFRSASWQHVHQIKPWILNFESTEIYSNNWENKFIIGKKTLTIKAVFLSLELLKRIKTNTYYIMFRENKFVDSEFKIRELIWWAPCHNLVNI